MTIPITSTSYPTLGVIHHYNVTDPAARRAIWARSRVWGDRVRAHREDPHAAFRDELRSPETFAELKRHFGHRVVEIDDAIHTAQRRAWAWCLENMS